MEYLHRSEQIQRRILGENHPDYALTLSNLATSLDKLGEHEMAIEYNERCLKIQKEILCDNHPEIAKTLNNLGLCFQNLGLY